MQSLILFLSLLILKSHSFAQSGWVKVKVSNDLTVKFPRQPNTDSKPERRLKLYTVKDDQSSCLFSVVVRGDAIPNYTRIENLHPSEKEKVISSFLDKGIAQFIQDSEELTPLKALRVGDFIGRELAYKQRDDNSRGWITQYTKFVLANNTLYIIQCSMYNENACLNDKATFLNSIITN